MLIYYVMLVNYLWGVWWIHGRNTWEFVDGTCCDGVGCATSWLCIVRNNVE